MRRVTSRQRLNSLGEYIATAENDSSDDESDYASCYTSMGSSRHGSIARNLSIGSFSAGFASACPSFDDRNSSSCKSGEPLEYNAGLMMNGNDEPELVSDDYDNNYKVEFYPKKQRDPQMMRKSVSFSELVIERQQQNSMVQSPPSFPTIIYKTYTLMNINQDTQLDIISFLPIEEVQSLGMTCRYFHEMLVGYNDREDQNQHIARNIIWWDLMSKKWPHLTALSQYQATNATKQILFKDDTTTNTSHKIHYGALLRHSSINRSPTQIDSCFFTLTSSSSEENAEEGTLPNTPFIVNLRRPSPIRKFLTFKMKTDLFKDLDQVHVVQFTGQVGRGDRSIRSNQPFPRPLESHPVFDTTKNVCSLAQENDNESYIRKSRRRKRKERRSLVEHNETSEKPKLPFFRLLRRNVSDLQKMNVWQRNSIPFVCPYVSSQTPVETKESEVSAMDKLLEIDLTPRMIAYFEVSILERDETQEPEREGIWPEVDAAPRTTSSACVAIGISTSQYNSYGRMPGWDLHSYGYHGDDGGLFHGKGDMIRVYGPNYGKGDTVGCGVNYENGGIFYTLNGNFLGYAWCNERVVKDGMTDFFPTVGVDTDCPLACNFGHERPFVFDFAKFVSKKGSLPL